MVLQHTGINLAVVKLVLDVSVAVQVSKVGVFANYSPAYGVSYHKKWGGRAVVGASGAVLVYAPSKFRECHHGYFVGHAAFFHVALKRRNSLGHVAEQVGVATRACIARYHLVGVRVKTTNGR